MKPTPRPKQKNPRPPHIERIYVKVNSDFDCSGMVTPRSITWTDGRVFQIDEITDFRPASSLEPGRTGDRYTVIIHGEVKHLYFQRNHLISDHRIGRWWVEVIAL